MGRDVEDLAALTRLTPDEVIGRLEARNSCYVARVGGEPVGYGWTADASAAIGELDLAFRLEANERYLWDFVTLPARRGSRRVAREHRVVQRRNRAGPAAATRHHGPLLRLPLRFAFCLR